MKKQISPVIIIAGIAVLVMIVFSSSIFYTLKATQRGIIFKQFARVPLDKDNVYNPGFHMIAPWNDMIIFDVEERIQEEEMNVLDKNGMSMNVEISVRFKPVDEKIGYLYEKFKENYVKNLVIPEVRSVVRKVTGRYSAEEIYSTKRAEVEQCIEVEAGKILGDNYVDMKTLLIRQINLPTDIKQAIENKLKREQEALAMRFINERERQEAERKEIEANGIANYNKIVNASLTEQILKQRGIEATLKLAESPNSKIVVVGNGKDGLPLILGGDK